MSRPSPVSAAAVLAAGLVALPLGAQTASAAVGAPASARPGASVRVRRAVAAAGVYKVEVAVTPRDSAAQAVVRLQIGWHRRLLRTTAHRGMRLALEVTIPGRTLTVRATGQERAPRLTIRLARLHGLRATTTAPSHGTKASRPPGAPSTPALGATGVTGATGPLSSAAQTTAATDPGGPASATAPAGATTVMGTTGATAPGGASGTTGVTAATGTTGTTGTSGSTASTGTTGGGGSTGSTGTTGVTGATGGPPGPASSWQPMVFDDEFNGGSLDTSKWSTGWFGSGITAPITAGELQCYDPAQVSEGGGELDINLIAQPEICGGKTRPYASAMITTNGHFSFTYGYAEVRAWLPGNGQIADWPAFWADGQVWPQDGELDVLEGLGGYACWHFHNPLGAFGSCDPGSYTGGWHTFGADWEPGTVTYYYDGNPVGTLATAITGAPMYLILDLAADTINSGPIQAPATMRVDYVRVWQH